MIARTLSCLIDTREQGECERVNFNYNQCQIKVHVNSKHRVTHVTSEYLTVEVINIQVARE